LASEADRVASALQRIVATVLLSVQLVGCYVWHDVQAARPAQYLSDHSPKHARLTVARSAAMGILRASRIELLRPTWPRTRSVDPERATCRAIRHIRSPGTS